jgi:hypothetical protein
MNSGIILVLLALGFWCVVSALFIRFSMRSQKNRNCQREYEKKYFEDRIAAESAERIRFRGLSIADKESEWRVR